jgi:hypothetical protein
MLTFLEYFKGDKILNPNVTNGKKIDRAFDRSASGGSITTQPKEYKHKDSIVDNATATPVIVNGVRLQQLLQQYNTTFDAGQIKVLGNSDVEIEMLKDKKGRPYGRVKRRIKNDL